MKFKVDENLPVEVVNLLRKDKHNAETVLEQGLGGEPDPHIANICQREKRALITLDTDFSDIRKYSPEDFSGLIILRLKKQDKSHVLAIMNRITTILSEEPLEGHLWIV